MTAEQAAALFLLAGIKVSKFHQLENKYWPDAYVEERKRSPWWLAMTPAGPITIGWRKRVISIDWQDTALRTVVTEDEVTKGDTYVHAYCYAKAVEYLTTLSRAKATVTAVDGGSEHG